MVEGPEGRTRRTRECVNHFSLLRDSVARLSPRCSRQRMPVVGHITLSSLVMWALAVLSEHSLPRALFHDCSDAVHGRQLLASSYPYDMSIHDVIAIHGNLVLQDLAGSMELALSRSVRLLMTEQSFFWFRPRRHTCHALNSKRKPEKSTDDMQVRMPVLHYA